MSYLEAQNLGLNELQGTAVDLDEALTSLCTKCQHFRSLAKQHLPSFPPDQTPRTLHWATAVAVFFLPKHCTRWGVDDMLGSLYVVD